MNDSLRSNRLARAHAPFPSPPGKTARVRLGQYWENGRARVPGRSCSFPAEPRGLQLRVRPGPTCPAAPADPWAGVQDRPRPREGARKSVPDLRADLKAPGARLGARPANDLGKASRRTAGTPPLPARLVSSFPAARPAALAHPSPTVGHEAAPELRCRVRPGQSRPGQGSAPAPPPPPPPPPGARHVPGPAPASHAGNPGDVTVLQLSPSRALQKRREGGDVSWGLMRLRKRRPQQNVLRRRLVEEKHQTRRKRRSGREENVTDISSRSRGGGCHVTSPRPRRREPFNSSFF